MTRVSSEFEHDLYRKGKCIPSRCHRWQQAKGGHGTRRSVHRRLQNGESYDVRVGDSREVADGTHLRAGQRPLRLLDQSHRP